MRKRYLLIPFAMLLLALALGVNGLFRAVRPVDANAKPRFFKVVAGESKLEVLKRAEREGFLRSTTAARLYVRLFGPHGGRVRKGTYLLSPAMTAPQIVAKLFKSDPMRQMVLVREGLWGSEIAAIFENAGVSDKKSFNEVFYNPKLLSRDYPFTVDSKSLEGYLFPDTYDFPPLLGAKEAVEKMLYAFEKKVYEPLNRPSPAVLRKWLIIASMIELEAKKKNERAKIAGVLYNRLQKGMPLQVDAGILYAMQQRRRLFNSDYNFASPYNTYLRKGLPPGPICSPGSDSIYAAAHPTKHSYLYYVALPSGSHLFAQTYQQHLTNVAISRKAFAQVRKG